MRIERCSEMCDGWIALRCKLWPECDASVHREDARGLIARDSDALVVLARSDAGVVVGFAEAALRRDYVNGCSTSPVAFLEGIYVEPEFRRQAVARRLCAEVQRWGVDAGCTEFASDSLLDNESAHIVHRALGFTETERVVYFRKPLDA
ncbi:MAG: GNAT family N-acetyltransferase [Candidatus Eremiobacteraeota bacterium]|nr:GNAT family N-acetyltransferase [Candidatus Eremiobacteraeota bacterium]